MKLDYLESKITLTINNKDFETNVDLSLFFPKKDTHSIEEIVKELEDIVGNEKVKKYVLDLENNLKVQQIRQNAGFKATPISMHMIFTGNPGTGKTTIARIIAKYFKAIGLLSTGQLREVSRVDLVSQYVGNTAKLTNEVIQSAMGGVLFIDEAYSLCRDKNDIFGIEAVDSLVKAMEDYRDDLVVILAGYQNEMESFLKTNSGLASRFPNFIEFEDYKAPEMVQIADITAKSKGYKIEDDCKEPLLRLFEKSQIKGRNDSGNGRLVRNVIEKAILMQGNRVLKISDSKLDILKSEDFNFESSEEFDLEKQLNEIIGLENVKDFVRSLYKQLIANEKRRKAGIEVNSTQSLNMIFTGNPGTGKTTISRILATMFKEMGLLKKGHLVETDQGGLIAGYVGQTAKKTEELFRNALGGVLFIDEAYALSNDRSFGKEAIDTLIKLIEDFRGETVVILAGYKTEMAEFIKSNSGIESRFPLVIDFPDYTPSELYEIAVKIISQKGFTVTEDGLLALKELVTSSQKSSSAFSGNGRMARNIIEQVLRNQSSRIATNEEISFVGLTEIKREDVEQGLIKKNTYDLEKNLSNIVGLEEVKTYIRSLSAILRMQNERKKMGLPESNNQTLHMIFKGNPGTGKTMIARTIADVLFNIGVIKTNKLVETDRAGLVAGYVGQTALKTREIISEAMNGVLFIDEAYSLSQGGAGDFGREAIDTLVKLMDDNRERLVVILAGYSENMNDFLLSNPGLKSRFPNIIEFPDYSVDELMTIANNLYLSKGYFLKTEARNKLESTFKKALKENSFGNGRYVRNIFERTLNKQALRLNSDTDLTREELTTIMLEDIEVLF